MKENWVQSQQDKKVKSKNEGEEAKKDWKKERMGKWLPVISISMGI
jgi:hypothetical protein